MQDVVSLNSEYVNTLPDFDELFIQAAWSVYDP